MQQFRVILVGCGGISREELKPLTLRDDVEMVALVDPDENRARQLAQEFQLTDTAIYPQLEEALLAQTPDVAVDCTPPGCHRQVVTTALAHHCHVLGQKPMADSLEDAQAMVEAARRSGRQYGVIQTVRFNPLHLGLRDFLVDRPFGPLTHIDTRFFSGLHFPAGDFRLEMPHVLLVDMAIHHFDVMRMLTGSDPASVHCHDWNPNGSWFANGANTHAFFKMQDGSHFTYTGSWCAEGGSGLEWSFFGEHGSLLTRGKKAIVAKRVRSTPGFRSELDELPIQLPHLSPAQLGHAGAVNDFFDALQAGRSPMCPAEDNYKSFAMVDAAIRSAETGQEIQLELPAPV